MLLRVVDRNRLFYMLARQHKFSQPKMRIGHNVMADQNQSVVLAITRQAEHLVGDLARFFVLPLELVKLPETSQCRDQLGGFSDFVTQFKGPSVGVSDFRGGLALRTH